MNKLFFLLLLLPLTFFSQGDLNKTDSSGKKQGNWVKKDKNGGLIYEGQFKDDKPFGLFKYYYPDGTKKSEMVFSENGNIGRAKAYDFNGKLMAAGKYIGEKKDSTWKYFAAAGWVISEEVYKNGKKEGPVKNFYEDGNISGEYLYKNDKRNGTCTEYYPDKSLKMQSAYVNDSIQGKTTYYFPGGTISATGNYKMGVKDGLWKHNTSKGIPESQIIYKNGKVLKQQIDNGVLEDFYYSKVVIKDSLIRTTFSKPIPKATYTIKNSKRNGPFIEYYDAGKWKIIPIADPDGKEEMTEILEGQKVKCKGNYKDGKLDGKITFFKLEGTIDRVEDWKDGVKQ